MLNAPASSGFTRHSHDEFVISANVSGIERVRLDRHQFVVGVDEITLYNPGEVQSCSAAVDDDDRWSCASVYVDPEVVVGRLGGQVEFHRPYVVAPKARACLLELAMSPVDERMPQRVERLLDAVFAAAPLGHPRGAPEVEHARAWLSGGSRPYDPAAPLAVGDIAAHLGWTRETFTRRFTRATGTPPYAWHLQARLLVARRLLRQGRSPAEVAVEVGFADQAHLHKHFQPAYATTPGQVQAGQRTWSQSDKT